MNEDEIVLPGYGQAGVGYEYPADLARFVRGRWDDTQAGAEVPGTEVPGGAVLEELFATCFQASLLREEEREVTFRVILAGPELFEPGGGPPDGLHVLEFPQPRAFEPRELRRLSVAADFQRSLVGVEHDAEGGLRIWGLIHSGNRWLRDAQGGRRAGSPLPPAPVVHVEAPGTVEARKGDELIGKLEGGQVSGARADLFDSEWLQREFSQMLGKLGAEHEAAREQARKRLGERWAPLAPGLTRRIAERMLKRVISVARDARHGGTVVFVPSEKAGELCRENPYVDLKYPFVEGQSRVRLRSLIVGILNRKAHLHGTTDDGRAPEPVGWGDFETTTDGQISALDEALFEFAYLVAGLASTDGAVVMSKHHELLGFGGEISGALPGVRTVSRALDLEGEEVVEEAAEDQGTRHRSAYRLAAALPNAVIVVISQDGGVRFVSSRNGRVTCWDQE